MSEGERRPEPRSLCIIPARGGSKRIPRKNVRRLDGKPLLNYSVEAALESGVFDTVCVTSDDEDILGVAGDAGAEMLRKRPDRLAADDAQVKDVCLHVLEDLRDQGERYSVFGILLPTNPLRRASDVREAYDKFVESNGNYLMSLVSFRHPPQRSVSIDEGRVEAFFGREYMVQTQKLDTLYRHDGSVFLGQTDIFLEERQQYGSRIVPYIMPDHRSVDIDEPIDLEWAEFLLRRLKHKKR